MLGGSVTKWCWEVVSRGFVKMKLGSGVRR